MALVGYTNAGKTTLLNRIAGASAPTADQLFVTLDPAARLVSGGGRAPFVLTDTVGFIQKLPTQLVAAFKATLEELEDAQLLLHVVDVSHPHAREHMSAVYRVLEELGLEDRPALTVMNKIDRLAEPNGLLRETLAEGGVAVSARTGEGFEALFGAHRRGAPRDAVGLPAARAVRARRRPEPRLRAGSGAGARGPPRWNLARSSRCRERSRAWCAPTASPARMAPAQHEPADTWPVGRGTTLQEAGS